MAQIEETPAARVARGAAYMDEKYPGWERKIDLSTLDLSGPSTTCVVQQGAGLLAFCEVVADLAGRHGQFGSTGHYGFIDYKDEPSHVPLWIDLIKNRFDTGALSDGGAL